MVRRLKYEMCKNWREKGTCKYGDKCLFAHGEKELTKRSTANGPEPAKPAPAPASEQETKSADDKSSSAPQTEDSKEKDSKNDKEEPSMVKQLFETPAKEDSSLELLTPAFSNQEMSTQMSTEKKSELTATADQTFSKLSALAQVSGQ